MDQGELDAREANPMGEENDAFKVWDCDLKLAFPCSKTWESLGETADPDVRHCRFCSKDVHRCRTPSDFVAHSERGDCVAIPDGFHGTLSLGETSPAEHVRLQEIADRGEPWWDEVLALKPALSPKELDRIRRARELLSFHYHGPEHMAIMRLAARDGGVRCPKCAFDIAGDGWGPFLYLADRRCERCREPFELDLS